MVAFCRRLALSETFQTFILWFVLLTAFSMGLETVPYFEEHFGLWFEIFFYLTQIIFAVEIAVRLIAYAPRFRDFFNDFWNTFDFVVVTLSFLPGPGAFAPVARLARVIRVLRVFSISDRLRGFIDRMEESLDELVYAAMIVCVWGYIFTIAGNFLFFESDPAHWGSFGRSALSVFYLLLLQNVPSYVDAAIVSSRGNIAYFIFFYLIFFSLFVNVVAAISYEHHREGQGTAKND